MADINKELEHHDRVFSIFLDSLFNKPTDDPKDKDKDKEEEDKNENNNGTIPWGRKPKWEDDDENPLFI